MPHHFAINCNKYYVNKSHSVQIAPTQGQNANQNPQGGDAIDHQIPHICPTPPPPPLRVDRYTGYIRYSGICLDTSIGDIDNLKIPIYRHFGILLLIPN